MKLKNILFRYFENAFSLIITNLIPHLELFTFLCYNIVTSFSLNIFIGVCCLKNTNLLEIVL